MYKQDLLDYLSHHSSFSAPMWLKRVRKDILAWILQETQQFETKNIMENVFIILNGNPPICSDGNYRKFDTYDKGYRICCHLGNKCIDVKHNRISNQKQTLIKTYGVEIAMDVPGVKEKIKQTNIKRYGVEHHSQNEEVKRKTLDSRKNRTLEEINDSRQKTTMTNLEKYGVAHHMKLISQQEKVQNTNIEKREVAFPLQSYESLAKMQSTRKSNHLQTDINLKSKQTLIERYGVDAVSRIKLSKETIAILSDKEKFINFVSGKSRDEVTKTLGICDHTLYLYAKRYEASEMFIRPLMSEFEREVAAYLSSLGVEFVQNDRKMIASKELDFYIPKYNLAIECCGLYWHSENSANRNRNYHITKHNLCNQNNIRLLTIFQDEWVKKKSHVMSILSTIFGNTKQLYARNCVIKELTNDDVKDFIEQNHIQGYIPAKINLALNYEDKIVAVMSFGKSRYNKNFDYELIRYCTNAKITGGANRLFNYFLKKYNPTTVISYCDNRWFTGNVYKTLGFTKGKTTVGYFYTDYISRYDRQRFQKHKLIKEGFDQDLSEWQIMQSRNFDRIWDCGQTSWEFDINKNKR